VRYEKHAQRFAVLRTAQTVEYDPGFFAHFRSCRRSGASTSKSSRKGSFKTRRSRVNQGMTANGSNRIRVRLEYQLDSMRITTEVVLNLGRASLAELQGLPRLPYQEVACRTWTSKDSEETSRMLPADRWDVCTSCHVSQMERG
jgi:hypothetical protein